jgi:hypothetical protein
MTCSLAIDKPKVKMGKTPTKDEYKTKAFLMALLDDADRAIKYAPIPRLGKDGNSKIHHRGAKAMTLVYSGLAWHDCMPTAGCDSCYAMGYRYLNSHGWRKGTSHLYSFLARYHPDLLEGIIRSEIKDGAREANRLRIQLAIRVHEAGDFINVKHVEMWHNIIRANPNTIFWAYTRSDKMSDEMKQAIQEMAKEPNMHIRASEDPAEPDDVVLERNGMPTAIISGRISKNNKKLKSPSNPKGKKLVGQMKIDGTVNCPEQMTFGKIGCADCGLCWHASKPAIRFWKH